MSTIIIAAHTIETEPLEQQCPQIPIMHFGVGAINAAHNVVSLSPELKDRKVIYLGTAGIFGEFSEPEAYTAKQVFWSDIGTRSNQAYVIQGDLTPHDLVPLALLNERTANVTCSASISTQPHVGFAESTTPTLENVELYSVASHVKKVAKNFSAVLVTTNSIGLQAHDQWQRNHEFAAQMSAEIIINHLTESGEL